MAQRKYRPGMNCEESGKYTCYDAQGNKMYSDIDVEKGKRFPPSQEEGCYYQADQLPKKSLSNDRLFYYFLIKRTLMIPLLARIAANNSSLTSSSVSNKVYE